jgi:hypothetical protein
MLAEGKLPTPWLDQGGGASWTAKAIERWAERKWWGRDLGGPGRSRRFAKMRERNKACG